MSVSQARAFTQLTSDPVVSAKTFLWVYSTTFISGRHSSGTALTRPKSCSLTTEFGLVALKALESFPRPMP